MIKRTTYSYGEASYAQRLVRVGHKGIRVSESSCVSPVIEYVAGTYGVHTSLK